MCSSKSYIAIDLKSFYASVECRERMLDPLTTNLVVADVSRTEKTICLAVSPSLKSYGIGGRARLFEVVQRVNEVNAERLRRLRLRNGNAAFSHSSFSNNEVLENPCAALGFLAAKPRMSLYLDYSTRIYEVYLKYLAPEDIHVYSIDEILADATNYLHTYKMSAKELASKIITDVYRTTGITATAGIGTNLYLAKVAMDILAKHEEPDSNGVRVAALDEQSYKQRLWSHEPITDFWRVGHGIANRLAKYGMHTMGDVARCSLGSAADSLNENLLFDIFGKNAELLIDHAWGYEPVGIRDVKAYKPQEKSTVAGQVLHHPYPFNDARLVAWEMADQLALDLASAKMETRKIVLTVSYDRENLDNPKIAAQYKGEIVEDGFGRRLPKHTHGTKALPQPTSSSHSITKATLDLFDELVDKRLLVRKISITADQLIDEAEARNLKEHGQMALFDERPNDSEDGISPEREKQIQNTMLEIREKFGKNAILKAPSLKENATARQRNNQIGGHSA